jgi:hypothetical protein
LGVIKNTLYFDLNIGENYLGNWEPWVALRELIANALDEDGKGDVEAKLRDDGTIVIRDKGKGLKPEHFIFQEFEKSQRDDKIGKFGVGLKDAIGVLWSKNIGVEIRSNSYKFSFLMKEKSTGSCYKTLHTCIEEIENDDFVGTEFKIVGCPDNELEEAKQQFIKFQNLKVLVTSNKGQILDKNIEETASIYVNSMKIAEDKKLRFSYNITKPSSKVKQGINRERRYVRRSVYQTDLVEILKKVDVECVLETLAEQLKRTYEKQSLDEVSWNDVLIKVCNYVVSKGNIVFVSSEDIEKSNLTYNLLSQNRKIKIVKVAPDIMVTLRKNLILISSTKIFMEHFAGELQHIIPHEELTEWERDNLNRVVNLLKEMSVLKSEHYLLNDIRISKEGNSFTDVEKEVIIIPRECLGSVINCSSKIINALASVRQGANQFKDYIIGELCSEFLQLKEKD